MHFHKFHQHLRFSILTLSHASYVKEPESSNEYRKCTQINDSPAISKLLARISHKVPLRDRSNAVL